MASLLQSLIRYALGLGPYLILVTFISYLISNYFCRGLQKYPGPFLARLTDWWRFVDVYKRRPEVTHINLHRKHGDIVRLGPNALSFADPKALKTIYGLNKGFVKSQFYPVQAAVSGSQTLLSLFTILDEKEHADVKRSVNSAFSMSAMVQYEPMVNSTTEVFLDQTEKLYASEGKTVDFANWLQFYAFDVIGAITYSKRHGFVDRNEDVDGMVGYLGSLFSYVAPVGQMPFLDKIFLKNPIFGILNRYGLRDSTSAVAKFAKARMGERLAEAELKKDGKGSGVQLARPDLLTMFLRAKEARPEVMNDKRVLTMATSMAFAGSETTAISLSAVFYYLLKNPSCLEKLNHELDTAVRDGVVEDRPGRLVSWAESQKLPYLDACIKEAFRLHPAAGLPLERIVPPQGVSICGEYIKGGTIVGCSAWIIHRRPEIFGEKVDDYRPERWIEADADRLKEMNGAMFQFGAGPRTCIGKNISLMEIYKLVPSFLRRFEVRLANPDKEWTLHNAWFVKQLNFNTVFKSRNPEE
ncbi:hypothetical protein FQN54_003673 [Arachnomyces sp. PD_36]|nr:hypothetical protein FQN54_003673 [Arachnomyces sp. PD_36]